MRIRPFWISLPPLHLPTTRKGGYSRRTACRLTRHIITPSPLRSPRVSGPPIVLRATHRVLLPLLPVSSSSSSHPDIFTLPSSPVATLRASIRAGQQPLRHPVVPRCLVVEAIWPPLHTGYITAALLNYVRYFSSQGERKREIKRGRSRALSLALYFPCRRYAPSLEAERG